MLHIVNMKKIILEIPDGEQKIDPLYWDAWITPLYPVDRSAAR